MKFLQVLILISLLLTGCTRDNKHAETEKLLSVVDSIIKNTDSLVMEVDSLKKLLEQPMNKENPLEQIYQINYYKGIDRYRISKWQAKMQSVYLYDWEFIEPQPEHYFVWISDITLATKFKTYKRAEYILNEYLKTAETKPDSTFKR